MIRRLVPYGWGAGAGSARRSLQLSIIAVLVTALAVTGAGITFALWTSSAEATSTASTADLELTTSGFDTSLAKTFGNHDLATTGSVTVKNTTVTQSTQPGNYSVSLSSTGSATLAAKLAVAVWPVADPITCAGTSTPGTALTGTWASFTAPISGSLTAGEQQSYCVRVEAAERGELASTSGSLELEPTIAATLVVGGWSDSVTSSTSQKTAWIYPSHGPQSITWYQLRNASTNQCVDVNSGVVDTSEWLIDYACKTETDSYAYNQHWRFSAMGDDYYEVIPRHAQALRLDVPGDPAPTSAGVSTRILDRDPTRQIQQWQLQNRGGGAYQLVNRLTGLCLQPLETGMVAGQTEYAPMVCNGSAAQSFSLTSRGTETPVISALDCTNTPGSTGQSVVLSWQEPAVDTYVVQARKTTGTTWTTLGTVEPGDTTYQVPAADSTWTNGTRTVRITHDGTQLDSRTLWKGSSPDRLRCSAPVANVDGLTCTNTPTGITYTWAEPAVGSYRFQARTGNSGTWRDLGTAASDSTEFTVSGATHTSIEAGMANMRVRSSSNSTLATGTVWKGVLTEGGTAILQCSQPPAPITSLTCTNSGSRDVTIGWGHPAVGPYELEFLTIQGEWDPITTASQGAESQTISAGSNWANQDRTLRVTFGSAEATIVVSKTSTGNNHYLRCKAGPDDDGDTGITLTCAANDGYNAYFSWPQLQGYQNSVSYRAWIGGIEVTNLKRATGWDTVAQFGWNTETAAIYGTGVKVVEIRQSVSGGPWTMVGTGLLRISTVHGDYLSCGS
jgi:hypothetical protein